VRLCRIIDYSYGKNSLNVGVDPTENDPTEPNKMADWQPVWISVTIHCM